MGSWPACLTILMRALPKRRPVTAKCLFFFQPTCSASWWNLPWQADKAFSGTGATHFFVTFFLLGARPRVTNVSQYISDIKVWYYNSHLTLVFHQPQLVGACNKSIVVGWQSTSKLKRGHFLTWTISMIANYIDDIKRN